MTRLCCGLWPTPRGLVAAAVDPGAALIACERLPAEDDEQLLWLSRLELRHGCTGVELVMIERTARQEPLAPRALEIGYRLSVADEVIAQTVARAAWYRPAPRHLATVLARMPRVRALSRSLRRAPLPPIPSQLRLF